MHGPLDVRYFIYGLIVLFTIQMKGILIKFPSLNSPV